MAGKVLKGGKDWRSIFRTICRTIYRVLLIVGVVSMILSYLSAYINPTKFIIPLFFGLYFIPILLLNVWLLLVAVIFRFKKSIALCILVLIPSFFFANRFYKLSFSKDEEEAAERRYVQDTSFSHSRSYFKILSYNVGGFSQNPDLAKDSIRHAIIDSINAVNADIVCLQEVSLRQGDSLLKLFPNYKNSAANFKNVSKRSRGLVILSKFKIINTGIISFKNSSNLSMFVDIDFGLDTMRLFNNHLESYALSFKSLITRLKTKDTTAQMAGEEIYNVHKKIGKTVQRRTLQVDSIARMISLSPYKTLICGDINETPISYAYTTFARDHMDTFKESGRGYGSSFRTFYPLIRIDYIFVPHWYNPVSHKTLKWIYSDHYPIVSIVDVPFSMSENPEEMPERLYREWRRSNT